MEIQFGAVKANLEFHFPSGRYGRLECGNVRIENNNSGLVVWRDGRHLPGVLSEEDKYNLRLLLADIQDPSLGRVIYLERRNNLLFRNGPDWLPILLNRIKEAKM